MPPSPTPLASIPGELAEPVPVTSSAALTRADARLQWVFLNGRQRSSLAGSGSGSGEIAMTWGFLAGCGGPACRAD
jgi:hypothetical protein